MGRDGDGMYVVLEGDPMNTNTVFPHSTFFSVFVVSSTWLHPGGLLVTSTA